MILKEHWMFPAHVVRFLHYFFFWERDVIFFIIKNIIVFMTTVLAQKIKSQFNRLDHAAKPLHDIVKH